ncbi:hypothetical protein [uncultured Cocleimonas sp.]|uniref:hypothetical protein n=1 Tax=uncultured Cocleimonas sp. TaxID=1051587 RepID=UPI002637737E|nr:hypothetical protein [uncultured Cocleimonas sp.]
MRSVNNIKTNTQAQKRKQITKSKVLNSVRKKFKTLPISICFVVLPVIFSPSGAMETKHDFDNATIIGKVFHDENNNGIQDTNEYGIPGVRLATVSGLLLETDGYGRYHIPDNKINPKLSRNFIVKIDAASLPTGSIIQSENPRVVRLTNGSLNKINFAVQY